MLEVRVELGTFAEDLATRLANELPEKGIAVGKPFEEEWGWVLPLQNKDYDAWVGFRCINAETGLFHVSIFPYESMIFLPNFSRVSTEPFVAKVADALEEIFGHKSAELVGWYQLAA